MAVSLSGARKALTHGLSVVMWLKSVASLLHLLRRGSVGVRDVWCLGDVRLYGKDVEPCLKMDLTTLRDADGVPASRMLR